MSSQNQTTAKKLLLMGIDAVNEEYYYVGNDTDRYALCNIEKELGDLLIEKYPDFINNGGTRIEPIERFDLYGTNIDEPALSFEEFWEEYLRFDDDISWGKGYRTFEEFKKGEGFE